MPKPDNRADNAERIEDTIQHTLQNVHQTEDFVKANSEHLTDEEVSFLKEKNERRAASVDSLRSELKEEANYQQRREH
ncbi:small acid-soluble spore protein Tlp [Terribacillus halophilus]|jgi:small acid-soluble spore protein (thioredoxin-like protein)|uniref:small acid-soluble spore protein Tlp n=1 Tax=Terribacillus halophilus TaxID=361279 RepID=UPI002119603C|nr:small acid-soluble spore protein Tlp [Terribacillus halophilus]